MRQQISQVLQLERLTLSSLPNRRLDPTRNPGQRPRRSGPFVIRHNPFRRPCSMHDLDMRILVDVCSHTKDKNIPTRGPTSFPAKHTLCRDTLPVRTTRCVCTSSPLMLFQQTTNTAHQTWLSYGVIHFISPFLAAFWLWLFASPGVVSIFAWAFGIQNCLGIITHLSFPTAAPWYGDQYGYPLPPGNYSMPGSAAGLVRVDEVLGTHIYQNAFKASPLVFGAFPSLHGAFSCCCFLFVARYSRKGAFLLGFYVLWQWYSTIYLRHHWRIDLLGGLIYSAFVFSIFYRSLVRIDRAYALGVNGGNGWQRIFEGTRFQCLFDGKLERGYEMVMESSEDGYSGRTSVDAMVDEYRTDDLEASWVDDLDPFWKVRDPAESVS